MQWFLSKFAPTVVSDAAEVIHLHRTPGIAPKTGVVSFCKLFSRPIWGNLGFWWTWGLHEAWLCTTSTLTWHWIDILFTEHEAWQLRLPALPALPVACKPLIYWCRRTAVVWRRYPSHSICFKFGMFYCYVFGASVIVAIVSKGPLQQICCHWIWIK